MAALWSSPELTAALSARAACTSVHFGSGGFLTGQTGSQIELIAYGLQLAIEAKKCSVRFSPAQIHTENDLMQLEERIDVSAVSGATDCAADADEPSFACGPAVASLPDQLPLVPVGRNLRPLRRAMLALVEPRLRACGPRASVAAQDTVVHMRSGDVFDLEGGQAAWPSHAQPPCAFYDQVAKDTEGKLVVVTEADAKPQNPCIARLQKQYGSQVVMGSSRHPPAILAKDPRRGLRDDFCSLRQARSVAVASSSFAMAAVLLLNKNVSRVYVPFPTLAKLPTAGLPLDRQFQEGDCSHSVGSPGWASSAWSDAPLSYEQRLAVFPGFYDAVLPVTSLREEAAAGRKKRGAEERARQRPLGLREEGCGADGRKWNMGAYEAYEARRIVWHTVEPS